MWKGKKKLNDAGMSLVELIVVILIMGILSAGSAVGITYASRMNADSAAEKLVSMLERTRVTTLAADSEVKLYLLKEDNTYYAKLVQGVTEVEKLKLGNGNLSIVVKEGPTINHNLNTQTCEVQYYKSNGAFSSPYTSVEITGSKTKTVRMVTATGRSYYE